MALSRDQILSADDIQTRSVNVPQWGGEVIIRTLNGLEKEHLETHLQEFKRGRVATAKNAFRAVALMLSCVDEEGKKLFSNADLEALAGKAGQALDIVVDAILRLNAMTNEEVAALEGN